MDVDKAADMYRALDAMPLDEREELAKRLCSGVLAHGGTAVQMDMFMFGLQTAVNAMGLPEEGSVVIVIQLLTIWIDQLHADAGGCVVEAKKAKNGAKKQGRVRRPT